MNSDNFDTITFEDVDGFQDDLKDIVQIQRENIVMDLKKSAVGNKNPKFGQNEFYEKVSVIDGVGNHFEAYFTVDQIRKAIIRGQKNESLKLGIPVNFLRK